MNDKQYKVVWSFWLQWVVANFAGMFLGFFLGFLFTAVIYKPVPEPFKELVSILMFGTVLGSVVGLLQWFVLRRHVSNTGWWILTNIAVAFGIFFSGLDSFVNFIAVLRWTGIVALGCTITGILQWLVLRQKVERSGLWVLVGTFSLLLCAILWRAIRWGEGRDTDALIGTTLAGVYTGMVTGGALVWLLRQPATET